MVQILNGYGIMFDEPELSGTESGRTTTSAGTPTTQEFPLLAVSSGNGYSDCSSPTTSPYNTFGSYTRNAFAPPAYDVFLGGSCGTTVWRKNEVIPFLEKRGITYFDPQKSVWDQNMIVEEDVAKENSSLILFVIDPSTTNATSYLEIAYFAARRTPKMVVVFLNQAQWQINGLPEDRADRQRVCENLDALLLMHNVPVLRSIKDALGYIDDAILGQKSWSEAMANPLQRLPFMMLKSRRVLQKTAHQAGNAWKIVKNSFGKPSGSSFFLIFLAELLVVLAVNFSVYDFPLLWVLLPFLTLDVVLAMFFLIRYRCKTSAAAKQRQYLMQQRVLVTKGPVAIPGRSIVPCEIQASACGNVKVKKAVATSEKQKRGFSSILQNFRVFEKVVPAPQEKYSWTTRSGIDLYLACSSPREFDLNHMTEQAEKWMSKKSLKLKYERDPSTDIAKRMVTISSARHIVYYCPTADTLLSAFVEVAYILGRYNWHVSLCLPSEGGRCLVTESRDKHVIKEYEDRNKNYNTAFKYLKAMSKARNFQTFEKLDEALKHAYACLSA